MSEQIANWLLNYLPADEHTEKEMLSAKFSLQVIISETIKTLFLFLFFTMIGQFDLFFIAWLILMMIRPLSGGLHFDSEWVCLAFSISAFGFSIISYYLFTSIEWIFLFLFAVSIPIYCIIAPLQNPNRPRLTIAKKSTYKGLTLVVVLLSNIVALTFGPMNSSLYIIPWIEFYMAIQLLSGKVVEMYVKE